MKSRCGEDIVFTPFAESGLAELRGWLDSDQRNEVLNAFSPRILETEGTLSSDFLSELLYPAGDSACSMLVTVRTSYHFLINVGYVQLSKLARGKPECTVNYMYIARAFRQKDYEYRTFQKIVDFVLKDLRCDRCLLWVAEDNYVFMALARTLRLKLVRINMEGRIKRYCYVAGKADGSPRMNAMLNKKFAINLDPGLTREEKVPNLRIHNYESFKGKLHEINRVHLSARASHKSIAYYSPIIKIATRGGSEEKPVAEHSRQDSVSTLQTTAKPGKNLQTPDSFRSEKKVSPLSSRRLTVRRPLGGAGRSIASPDRERSAVRIQYASPRLPRIGKLGHY